MRRSGQNHSGSIYSFGETDLATQRLRVLSEVFDPASEAFISAAARGRTRLALDLGCGPGFTTRLLSRVLKPLKTVGVDRSEAFLNRAREDSSDAVEYVAADVAETSLRIGDPDLIYARFLASHLPEPERAISGWIGELDTGGLLLIEEVESISSEIAVFEEYLNIVAGMLAYHGNELYIGARLGAARWNDAAVEINRAAEVRPRTGQAARMFSMNLSNWRHDPYVESTYPRDKVEQLAVGLNRLVGSSETGRIAWRIRQIALRRHPT